MKGYHQVRTFKVYDDISDGTSAYGLLPDGWKPFAAWPNHDGSITVVCRLWTREDDE